MLLGLGASSISDVWIGFAQNEKRIEAYEEVLKEHHIALVKGHLLTEEDLLVRELILDLICKGSATIPFSIWENIPAKNKQALKELEEEGLLTLTDLQLTIHPDGMAVVRNICSNFDLRMIQTQEKKAVFSKAI
jgi:oxygen-independent coproporphyrinogen-3 oxidase